MLNVVGKVSWDWQDRSRGSYVASKVEGNYGAHVLKWEKRLSELKMKKESMSWV